MTPVIKKSLILLLLLLSGAHAAGAPSPATPPMGWMNWEVFRCNVDCASDPTRCVNAALFRTHADLLVEGGYLAAGYDTVHVDDCWMAKKRDGGGQGGRLRANATRFPEGMAALSAYVHARGVKFGLYTAESWQTCAGYPASRGYEEADAETFAGWGVDYMKVDGCGDPAYYSEGYAAMGKALRKSGRDIVYSCSWPAYLGDNETAKASCYEKAIEIGCHLWRNWADIQCGWPSLASIIEHWGTYGEFMAQYAGPGHFNDPDMLLIGNTCITESEARTQMALWCIVAAPLIMGNDLRTVSERHRAILLNGEAIAVNQDPLGIQGTRVRGDITTGQVWIRLLHDGGHAVALYNPTDAPLEIELIFKESGLAEHMIARDIWTQKTLGLIQQGVVVTVGAHDTRLFKLNSAHTDSMSAA